MIPILWRYISASYLKTLLLSLTTFILVLLVSRFKEIARFTSISDQPLKIGLFTVYQIPFILPMAIPLSALIAAFLLFQQMSRSHELTSLRASGLGLKKILTPLLFAGAFLTLINFSICGEIAPYCKRLSKETLFLETTSNPLSCIQGKAFLNRNDAFIKSSTDPEKKEISPLLLITYNQSNHRLNLVRAQNLRLDGEQLLGSDVSILSHLEGRDDEFDPLIIESQQLMAVSAASFEQVFKKNTPKLDGSMLNFRMLLSRIEEHNKFSNSAYSELFRRISIAFSVLSFTFLGAVFGIEHSRNPIKKQLAILFLLSLIGLASFFLGKGLKYAPLASATVYLIPHLLIWSSCLLRLRRLSKGTL